MTEPDPLNSLLQKWEVSPSDSPHFTGGVHDRIHRPAPVTLARIVHFPATLPLAAGFAIVLGIASALTLNRTQTQSKMAEAYARSIDPVWMTTTAPHPHP